MDRLRWALGTLREEYRDPSFWLEGPSFLWRHVLTAPLRRAGWAYRWRRGDGDHFTVADADWDNCIVLDACRYDAFEAVADPSWDLERRLAAGSDTGQFLAANYPLSSSTPDLVYVNANPRVAKEPTGEFHEIRHVWQSRWNDEYDTVMPEDAADAALEAAADHPDKRLLVHMVQPHIPYIGPTAEELPGGASIQSMRDGEEATEQKPYAAVEDGLVDADTVRTAYRESLELAMPHVERLVEQLDGKTVVTGDHGDLLGERDGLPFGEFSAWGHPANTPAEPLAAVPWAVPLFDERKDVRAGDATDSNLTDPKHDHLEALGYR